MNKSREQGTFKINFNTYVHCIVIKPSRESTGGFGNKWTQTSQHVLNHKSQNILHWKRIQKQYKSAIS